jgi:hypothetical protein
VSPDCPVHQRSNGYPAQRSTATAPLRVNSEEQCAQSQSHSVRGAPDSEQDLSGGAPDCPVPLEDKASNGQLLQYPNGWVTWWRTGQCPVRPSTTAIPNGLLVVEGYKYPPQPPQLEESKFSEVLIQYKS